MVPPSPALKLSGLLAFAAQERHVDVYQKGRVFGCMCKARPKRFEAYAAECQLAAWPRAVTRRTAHHAMGLRPQRDIADVEHVWNGHGTEYGGNPDD